MSRQERFWTGKIVALTGSTRFLGSVLLERILKTLPDVPKIFLLVFTEKNMETKQSVVDQLFASPVFRCLGEQSVVRYQEKIVIVPCQILQSSLQIHPDDESRLCSETNVFIHTATSNDMEDDISAAINIDVNVSQQLLALAQKMPSLDIFVYISSAYVNTWLRRTSRGDSLLIEEERYRLPFNPRDVAHYLQTGTNTDIITRLLSKYANNCSTFAKALAEHHLISLRENVPLLIVRPSFIGATYREPFPGWISETNRVSELFVGIGLGVAPFIPGRADVPLDIVPCDYVAHIILSAIAVLRTNRSLHSEGVFIIHATTSGSSNPLKWGFALQTVAKFWQKNPLTNATATKPTTVLIPNRMHYFARDFLQNKTPSLLYTVVSKFTHSQLHMPWSNKVNDSISKHTTLVQNIRPLIENEWIFQNNNFKLIQRSLHPDSSENSEQNEMELFDFNTIDWHEYLQLYCYGLKVHLLHELDGNKWQPPNLKQLQFDRLLTRDIDGHNTQEKRFFSDIKFALCSSREVRVPHLTKHRELSLSVLHSKRIRDAIQSVSTQKNIPLEAVEEQAKAIIDRMATRLHMPVVRTVAWFFRKVWRQMYDRVDVNETELRKLPELIHKGPVILVPSHRSYIDFLILSFILFAYDICIPHIAAGEDFLNLAFVASILRQCGAFFIRRTFRGDILYTAIFTDYVQKLLTLGVPVEFFIEGTRSRTGKMLHPKLGLLSVINDTFFEGSLEEITFVPININYEKTIEAEAYARELLGEAKKKETLENLIKARSVLSENFGRIFVRFGTPISLRQHVKTQTDELRHKRNPAFDPFINLTDRRQVNQSLANQIVSNINRLVVWNPTALVSALLLTHRSGIRKNQLLFEIEWLLSEIQRREEIGHQDWLATFPTSEALLSRALTMLGHLVTLKKDTVMISTNTTLVHAFYRNSLLHLFLKESFILCALTSLINQTLNVKMSSLANNSVAVSDVIKEAQFLSELLRFEFIDTLEPMKVEELERTLENLEKREIVTIKRENNFIEINPYFNRKVGAENNNTISISSKVNFYCSLVWPFVDSYWVAAIVLNEQKPNGNSISSLIQQMQSVTESLLTEGTLLHQESCSSDTLKNALMIFQTWNVISVSEGGQKVFFQMKSQEQQSHFQFLIERIRCLCRKPPTPHPTLRSKL